MTWDVETAGPVSVVVSSLAPLTVISGVSDALGVVVDVLPGAFELW